MGNDEIKEALDEIKNKVSETWEAHNALRDSVQRDHDDTIRNSAGLVALKESVGQALESFGEIMNAELSTIKKLGYVIVAGMFLSFMSQNVYSGFKPNQIQADKSASFKVIVHQKPGCLPGDQKNNSSLSAHCDPGPQPATFPQNYAIAPSHRSTP